MNGFQAAGEGPSHTLPAALQEAVDAVRPVLVAGSQPQAVVILLDVEAQGVD